MPTYKYVQFTLDPRDNLGNWTLMLSKSEGQLLITIHWNNQLDKPNQSEFLVPFSKMQKMLKELETPKNSS